MADQRVRPRRNADARAKSARVTPLRLSSRQLQSINRGAKRFLQLDGWRTGSTVAVLLQSLVNSRQFTRTSILPKFSPRRRSTSACGLSQSLPVASRQVEALGGDVADSSPIACGRDPEV